MTASLKLSLAAAACAVGMGILAGCVAEGSAGYTEVDYYGPAYDGAIVYGHPWVHGDVYIAHPPERHFTPRPEGGHNAAPHGGGGGGRGGGGGGDHRR